MDSCKVEKIELPKCVLIYAIDAGISIEFRGKVRDIFTSAKFCESKEVALRYVSQLINKGYGVKYEVIEKADSHSLYSFSACGEWKIDTKKLKGEVGSE